MYKIAFVIPYFTKGNSMPNYFPLWLKTVGWNQDVDFLIFTDADLSAYRIPDNVFIYPFKWDGMVDRIKEFFDFKISLTTPYKLCDLKPAYGEIFEDYLKGYDYWGHCDIDLFFGKIRKFLPDELLVKYDRFYSRGHCCIYKNDIKVNRWYRSLPHYDYCDYRDVFSTNKSCCFDEWGMHAGGVYLR